MSHDRKEPTLSNPNATAAEKRPVSPGGQKKPTPRQAPSPRQQVIVKKQSSFLLWLTFLIALSTAGAIAYTFWQLFQSQQIITEQQSRIDELENKLLLSDDESTQSLTALTANLKGLDKDVKLALSEVDKLWGTRNTNRKAITDSDKKLEGISNSTKKLEASIVKTQGNIAAVEEKLSKPMSSLRQRSSEQELLVQSLRERLSEQGQTISALESKVKQYASKKDIQALSKKIKGHDEAVESFDKFRITVNRDLLSLKQRAGTPAPQ